MGSVVAFELQVVIWSGQIWYKYVIASYRAASLTCKMNNKLLAKYDIQKTFSISVETSVRVQNKRSQSPFLIVVKFSSRKKKKGEKYKIRRLKSFEIFKEPRELTSSCRRNCLCKRYLPFWEFLSISFLKDCLDMSDLKAGLSLASSFISKNLWELFY